MDFAAPGSRRSCDRDGVGHERVRDASDRRRCSRCRGPSGTRPRPPATARRRRPGRAPPAEPRGRTGWRPAADVRRRGACSKNSASKHIGTTRRPVCASRLRSCGVPKATSSNGRQAVGQLGVGRQLPDGLEQARPGPARIRAGPNACSRTIPQGDPQLELDHAQHDQRRSPAAVRRDARSASQRVQTATAATGVAKTAIPAKNRWNIVKSPRRAPHTSAPTTRSPTVPRYRSASIGASLRTQEPGDRDRQEQPRHRGS